MANVPREDTSVPFFFAKAWGGVYAMSDSRRYGLV
jgi:hypothetical protein